MFVNDNFKSRRKSLINSFPDYKVVTVHINETTFYYGKPRKAQMFRFVDRFDIKNFETMKLLNLFALLLFLSLCGHAQEKQMMTISEMLEYAQAHNFDLKDAQFNALKADEKFKETRANGLPQVEGVLEYKDYLQKPTLILPGALAGSDQDIIMEYGLKHNMDASIQVSQLLFSLQYINGLRTTQKVQEIRGLEIEKSQIELFYLLYTEYYNLLAIYKNLDIINANIQSLDLNRQKVEAMVNGGLALQTDLDKIDVNKANLEVSKQQVLSGIKLQTNNLRYIIGMDETSELVVDTTGFAENFTQAALTEKYQNDFYNPNNLVDIKLLNKNIELNDYQIKTAKAEATPTIALFGSYMFQAQRNEFNIFDTSEDWYRVNVIGFKVSIPIFSGLGTKSKVNTAKIEKEATENKKSKALIGLRLQYQNSMMNYQTALSNCQIQSKNVGLAARVKTQEELKYQEGIGTLTDYLISEEDFRNAQINYVQNLLKMKKSEIDLLKSKGMLVQEMSASSHQ
jgi:outer membrane protein TolC